MCRIRKAWAISIEGYHSAIRYAPTASKARAQLIYDLMGAWGCTWKEALNSIVSCRRAPGADVRLPDRHPLAPLISEKVLHCVVHAYGGKGLRAGYRDHFYACASNWEMEAALYHGLFSIFRRDKGHKGQPDMIMYQLTDLGKNVAAGEAETYPRF